MNVNLNKSNLFKLLSCGIVLFMPNLAHAGGANANSGASSAGRHSAGHHSASNHNFRASHVSQTAPAPIHAPVSNPVASHPASIPPQAHMNAANHAAPPAPMVGHRVHHGHGHDNGMTRIAGQGVMRYGANYQQAGYVYGSSPSYGRSEVVLVPTASPMYPVSGYSSQEPYRYYAAPVAAPKIITIETVSSKPHHRNKHHRYSKHKIVKHSAHKHAAYGYGEPKVVSRVGSRVMPRDLQRVIYGSSSATTTYNTDYEPNMVSVRVRKD